MWSFWHAQYAAQRTGLHLPAGIEGVRTHASTSLLRMYVYRSVLSREQMRLALSKIEKHVEVAPARGVKDQTGSP